MTNKILILQNSVELYEHYIDDERWERTLAFPRGGLTYNISNGTIKFFAFEDYLYRNCLMSMQLPIYIIDDETGTEGEYSDIDDIIDILDSIFPTNGNGEGQDLSQYLKKREAEELYQPIGDYVTTYELDEVLDDYYTKDETDNLLDDKLDITAYTPFDPSNYYTKIEVDNKIASGGSFDPDQYYNKSQSDTRFALKNEIPSLSGYATEEWVTSRNYATRADFITYINNMQTQINSLIESVSGCCGTQEDVYRWLTLISQFICENHDKYEKQQYQVSHDGGIVWENVEPAQYRKGQLLEADSEDCGYAPDPQYRWKAAPTSDYLCIGTSKYYKVYYEVSYDNGQTWQHVQPEQTKRGDLIQAQSPDCGYIEPKYRWYTSQSEYICSGTTKYEKQYYQVSYDNGSTWQNVTPLQTRTGAVIEYQSTDCGYVPSLGKYRLTLNDSSVVTGACGSSSSITRSEVSTPYSTRVVKAEIGSCVNKIAISSFSGCTNLTSVTISNSVRLIDYAAFVYCSGLTSVTLPNGLTSFGQDAFGHCTSLTSVTIPNSVTSINNGVFMSCVSLKGIVIPNSVTSIGVGTFQNCARLKTVTIGSGITSINNNAFLNCSSLSSITCNAITPPTLGENVFAYTANCPIYVPAASVNAYKNASGWSNYASRIQAIP